MDFSIHHVAISVRDMQESIEFYRQFGFWVAVHYKDPTESFEVAQLKLQGMFLEIWWYAQQTSAPSSAAELRTDLPRIGVKHFALRVPSIEDAKLFVEQRGLARDVEIVQGRTGVTYFFIKDPSGNLLEFVEDRRNL